MQINYIWLNALALERYMIHYQSYITFHRHGDCKPQWSTGKWCCAHLHMKQTYKMTVTLFNNRTQQVWVHYICVTADECRVYLMWRLPSPTSLQTTRGMHPIHPRIEMDYIRTCIWTWKYYAQEFCRMHKPLEGCTSAVWIWKKKLGCESEAKIHRHRHSLTNVCSVRVLCI